MRRLERAVTRGLARTQMWATGQAMHTHTPMDNPHNGDVFCAQCGHPWPCPTLATMTARRARARRVLNETGTP